MDVFRENPVRIIKIREVDAPSFLHHFIELPDDARSDCYGCVFAGDRQAIPPGLNFDGFKLFEEFQVLIVFAAKIFEQI